MKTKIRSKKNLEIYIATERISSQKELGNRDGQNIDWLLCIPLNTAMESKK